MSVGSDGSPGIGSGIGGTVKDKDGSSGSGMPIDSDSDGSDGRLGIGMRMGGTVNDSPGNDGSGMPSDSEREGSAGSPGIGTRIGRTTSVGKLHSLTQGATFTLVDATPAIPAGPQMTGRTALAPSETEPAFTAISVPIMATLPSLPI